MKPGDLLRNHPDLAALEPDLDRLLCCAPEGQAARQREREEARLLTCPVCYVPAGESCDQRGECHEGRRLAGLRFALLRHPDDEGIR